MMQFVLAALCGLVMLSVIVPAWPKAPPSPSEPPPEPPKLRVVGYDKHGNPAHEKPKNKVDGYA